jgi:GMP reductase
VAEHQDDLISISIGIKQEDQQFLVNLFNKKLRIDFITIDVANGYNKYVAEMIRFVRTLYSDVIIIAGNVMTDVGVKYLRDNGADMVKVGIACGSACSTYNMTGIGRPMATTVYNCAFCSIPIIADGGIREIGDISKAIVLGASMVMAGSLFAACDDSPALTTFEGEKLFYGSASLTQKSLSLSRLVYVGGSTVKLKNNGLPYYGLLKTIEQGLKSSMSYLGVTCLKDMRYVQSWEKIIEK